MVLTRRRWNGKTPKSAKQAALLEAAVAIVAQSGLSATTASIAKRAEVAVGTLFTYFPTKEQLLNEVYLMLKQDMSDLLVSGYPKDADFRTQIMHIWRAYTEWSLKIRMESRCSGC
ncbi:hypothetical protein DMH27_16705 [Raoultella planticola]|nr:hypothetical protein [Raoultella planticola]